MFTSEQNSNLGNDELLTFYGTSFKTPNYKTKITIRAYMIFQSTSQGGSRKYTVKTPTGNHSWTLSSSSDDDTKQQSFTETIECPPNTTISISSEYVSGATNHWIDTFFIWGAGIKMS